MKHLSPISIFAGLTFLATVMLPLVIYFTGAPYFRDLFLPTVPEVVSTDREKKSLSPNPSQSNNPPTISKGDPEDREKELFKGLPIPDNNAPSEQDRPEPDKSKSHSYLSEILQFEIIAAVDSTSEHFPIDYFRQRVDEKLGTIETDVSHLRVGASFVEPRELRYRAMKGRAIGYILISLPELGDCSRQFGSAQQYDAPTPEIGIAKAIDVYAGSVADWLENATRGNEPKCPTG